MLGYTFDDDLRKKVNEFERKNYWDAYIEEILGMLGLNGRKLSLADFQDKNKLKDFSVLILGNLTGNKLTESALTTIDDWTANGGLLIGFGIKSLDDVFGIKTGRTKKQKEENDYAINGFFEFVPDELTFQLHPFHYLEQKLLILSEITYTEAANTKELGRLFDTHKNPEGCPAVTWRQHGRGLAGYFAFDVAKTTWLLHQGKPLSKEAFEHTSKRSIHGDNSRMVPYADELAFLIQNMIARKTLPFIYQIPPDDNRVPDALLYWSGDEYSGPTRLSLEASDWMKEKGLPYHINIEADRHPMSSEEYQHIIDNGHEVSLFFYMRPKEGEVTLTPDIFKRQVDIFKQRFGGCPGSTLFWHTNWQGWSEPARWMAEAGCTADNTFSGFHAYSDNPFKNGPYFNLSSGTAYPFFFYDDYSHENRRINLIEQPFAIYEMGHHGSMPLKKLFGQRNKCVRRNPSPY